jgi:Holliday junction resolvase
LAEQQKCPECGSFYLVRDGETGEVYAVQVKAGRKKPRVSWDELESFARMFNAKPLLLYKPDRRGFIEVWQRDCLESGITFKERNK